MNTPFLINVSLIIFSFFLGFTNPQQDSKRGSDWQPGDGNNYFVLVAYAYSNCSGEVFQVDVSPNSCVQIDREFNSWIEIEKNKEEINVNVFNTPTCNTLPVDALTFPPNVCIECPDCFINTTLFVFTYEVGNESTNIVPFNLVFFGFLILSTLLF